VTILRFSRAFRSTLTLCERNTANAIWSTERDEKAMLRLFLQLLRNEDGYTAVECGTLACLTVIFAEKLVS
jgi:hypothetical protein